MKSARIIFILAGAIVALLSPELAAASNLAGPGGTNSWTIYAFANTTILQGILQSSSALIANQSFRYLLEFLATVGFLGSVVGLGMFGGDFRKLAWPAVASTVFLTVGIGTTTNVTIQDTVVTGTSPTVAVVTNVPIIVALPESIVSTMGHQLAYLLDTFYSLPNQLTVTGGSGFNLAASLVRNSTKISIPDPLVRASLASYAENCIVPSIAAGTLSPYLLTTATQLWGANTGAATAVYPCGGAAGTTTPAMMCVNPSLMAVMYSDATPGGVVLPCAMPNGGLGASSSSGGTCGGGATGISSTTYNVSCAQTSYDYLNQVFFNGAPNWFQQGVGAWSSTGTYSWLGSELTSAQSYLFGGTLTQSTGATIEQSAAINAMSPALQAAAIASGQSQMVTSLAVAQAETSQTTSWATAVNLFQDLSGYIYSVLQAFLVAMTPIVLAAAFMPGAGIPMVKSYMKITIWLALWMPVLSIINYIVSLYGAQEMTGVFGGGSGGYSMQSMAPISQMSEHLVLAAGFLATLTPLITWALVNGSFAFTEFLAEGLGGRMASMAGSMAATGNVSLGNQSFHNTSMNQAMMATSTIVGSGAAQVMTNDGGVQVTNMQGGAIDKNPAGISAYRSASALNAQGVARQQSLANGAVVSATNNEELARSSADQAQKTLQHSSTSSSDAGTRLSADQSSRVAKEVDSQLNYAVGQGLVDSAAASKVHSEMAKGSIDPTKLLSSLTGLLKGGGKAGAGGFGVDGGLSTGVSQDNRLSHQDVRDVKSTTSDKSGDSASLARSAVLASLRSTIYSEQANAVEGTSHQAAEQYRNAAGFSQQASKSYSDAEQTTRRIEQSTSESGVAAYDSSRDATAGSRRVAAAISSAPQVGDRLPDPSTISPPSNSVSQGVTQSVASNDALGPVDGSSIAGSGRQAKLKSEQQISKDPSPAFDERKFEQQQRQNQAGLAYAQNTAGSAAASNTGDAQGQVAGKTAKAELGTANLADSTNFDSRQLREGTNATSPTDIVAPSGAGNLENQVIATVGPSIATDLAGKALSAKNVATAAEGVSGGSVGASAAGGSAVGSAAAAEGTVAASAAGGSGAASAGTGVAAAETATVGTAGAGPAATTGTGLATEGTLGVAAAPIAIGAAVIGASGWASKHLYETNPQYHNMLNSLYVKLGDDPKNFAPLPNPVQLTAQPGLRDASQILGGNNPTKLTNSEAIDINNVRKEQDSAGRSPQ